MKNRLYIYAHYKDQNDLLEQLQREAVEGIKSYIFTTRFTQQEDSAAPVIVKVLDYCKDNKALFRVLLSENGDTVFQRYLVLMVQEKTIDEIREDKRLDQRTVKYLERFVISGILSMIRQWLEEDCIDEPKEVADLMIRILYEGIIGIYHRP